MGGVLGGGSDISVNRLILGFEPRLTAPTALFHSTRVVKSVLVLRK